MGTDGRLHRKARRVEFFGAILPGAIYVRSTALRALGLGGATIRRARRAGIELATLRVGRMLLCRGGDVIEFVERLAALEAGDGNQPPPAVDS
jgi:hypothetical protein